MIFLRRPPVPLLAAHVVELWYVGDAPPHRTAHVLPGGTLEVIVDLGDDPMRIHRGGGVARYGGAVAVGAYRGHFGTETGARCTRMGAVFRAGKARPFVGVPPGELADTHVDLAELWGPRARELRERIYEAATPARRLELLERALVERLAHARAGHPAVPRAIAALATGGVRIADVAAEVGLSHRRLVDVFTAETGLGPKAFARLARFRATLALARRARTPDWAQLAHAAGYCDQSHLIREFVAITGDSPSALLARETAGLKEDHVVASDGARGDFQIVQDRSAMRR